MPRPVKTRPKFRCDFCRFAATEPTVRKHEGFCFFNPNRFCPTCKNTGIEKEWLAGDGINEPAYFDERPCPYCSKFNKDEPYPPLGNPTTIETRCETPQAGE